MKKANTPQQRAIAAIDAYINHPSRPTGFFMKEQVLELMGGADGCLTNAYDYRDSCRAMLDLLKSNRIDIHHHSAVSFLENAMEFFDFLTRDEYLRAEVTRDVVDLYGSDESEEYYENMVKQYELKLQLAILEDEGHSIHSRERNQKQAA